MEGILSLSLPSGSEVRQKSQRGANVIVACCVGLRSALHLPSHRSALLEQKGKVVYRRGIGKPAWPPERGQARWLGQECKVLQGAECGA